MLWIYGAIIESPIIVNADKISIHLNFENVYNIIYQLVAPDVNKIFATLLHVAWLYGG